MGYGKKGLSSEALQFYKSNKALMKKREEERIKENEEHKKQHIKEAHWMKCPKCGNCMEEFELSGVILDKCSSCLGIYFDAGELDVLLNAQKSEGIFESIKNFVAA